MGSATSATLPNSVFGSASLPDDSLVGSPLKKHRASLYEMDSETMQKRLGAAFSSGLGGDVVAAAEAAHTPLPGPAMKDGDEEEEL